MDYAEMSVGNMAEEHAAEGPLPQIVAGSIEELLARGSERGYVTHDELSATVPLDQLSSEEIEDTMTMLSELGLHPRWFGGPIKPDYLTDRLGANLDGMLAEYAVLNEEALVHIPSHLSFEEAATLPCAAVTAWVALTGHRRVTAGDTVLTQGSGGVSVFALQFARILGARVIATTSSAEKAGRLKALGASEVINYTETPDWDEKARELTDGRGVDCVVEIGGPRTITKSLKALAVGGHVSLIGESLSPSGTMLDPLLLTGRGITVGSISVGSRADFEAMNRAIASHRLRPVIDRTFPFAEAKEAYRHFDGRGHFGKVVIAHG